jgi:NhaP-type Na+/H+ or K+/H+ antiporter
MALVFPEVAAVIYSLFALLLGLMIQLTVNRVKWIGIPYTILVLLSGALMGVLVLFTPIGDSLLGEGFRAMSVINQAYFFYLLLPSILFESSFTMPFHKFKMQLWPSIWMATIGCGFTVSFVGLAIYVASASSAGGSTLPLVQSMLLASVLGSTDPTSVTTLLREVAPTQKNLIVLLESESLLNDMTGYVLYRICVAAAVVAAAVSHEAHDIETAGDYTLLILRLSVLSVAAGWVAGILLAFCLNRIYSQPLVEPLFLLFATYAIFIVAEAQLGQCSVCIYMTTRVLFCNILHAHTLILTHTHTHT